MNEILIEHCRLLSIENNQWVIAPEKTIWIKGNQIEAVYPSSALPAGVYSGEHQTRLDASGMIAAPGLINGHTNLLNTFLSGLGVLPDFQTLRDALSAKMISEGYAYWSILSGMAALLENGITTFVDNGHDLSLTARAVCGTGLRCILPCEIDMSVPEGLKLAETQFTNWHQGAGGRISVWLKMNIKESTPPGFLQQASRMARDHQTHILLDISKEIIAGHASKRTAVIKKLAESGVLDEGVVLLNATNLSADDVNLLMEYPVGTVVYPAFDSGLSGMAASNHGLADHLPVSIGTGDPLYQQHPDLLEQVVFARHVYRSNSANEIKNHVGLRNVLDIGAKTFFMDGQIGTIAAGMKADLTLFRDTAWDRFTGIIPLDQKVHAFRGYDVDSVICDGKLLLQNRQLLTIDPQTIKLKTKEYHLKQITNPPGGSNKNRQ